MNRLLGLVTPDSFGDGRERFAAREERLPSRQQILAEIMGQLDPDFTTIGVPDEWVKGPRWYGPGEAVTVRGFTIPDGMVYVGKTTGARNHHAEPSLIDPSLAIETGPITDHGPHLEYWMAYSSFQPEHRGAYLTWLADGRPSGPVPDAFPLLFLYGLERRVFVDLAKAPADDPELTEIRATLTGMLKKPAGRRYGGFRHHAESLIDFIDLRNDLAAGRPLPPPDLRSDRWQNRLRAQIELGRRVARGEGIPAYLALAWGLFHFDYAPRTAAIRCPDEVHRMFAILFDRNYPKGLIAKPGKTRLNATQSCANPALRYRPMQLPDLPDVFALRNPIKRIFRVYDDATDAIGPYSRWMSTHPDEPKSVAALSQLPVELIDATESALQPTHTWVSKTLAGRDQAVVNGTDLVKLWGTPAPDALSKAQSTSLMRLLSALGCGVVPDVRFSGPPISAKSKYVLFPVTVDTPQAPSDGYLNAEIILQSVLPVAAASSSKDRYSADRLIAYLGESSPRLEENDQPRIRAFYRLLTETPAGTNGLKRRLEIFWDRPERELLADKIFAFVAADGAVSPPEVAALTKVFKVFDFDAGFVTAKLHSHLTAGPARSTPTLKWKSAHTVSLDPELVKQKQRDTKHVGELLGTLFAEDEAPVPAVRGLDSAHALLLQELAHKTEWSRAEFDALAKKHRLLPDGALDTLNETALELADDYLLEGDDPLTINVAVLKTLLGG